MLEFPQRHLDRNIALELESAIPRFTVVVTGGTLRPMQHSLVDPLGGLMLERIDRSRTEREANVVQTSKNDTFSRAATWPTPGTWPRAGTPPAAPARPWTARSPPTGWTPSSR